ncbi:transmembrane protein 205 isoform X2 [Nematostella vectensis]|uniref:transmembrane protein 205 isoform X2 n=1 Tax=Nematostella vectensis TaxID=45351 RepID=UPI0020776137|nr:transmembrane protein 205 isoform X2 [Nematostella vectensis]
MGSSPYQCGVVMTSLLGVKVFACLVLICIVLFSDCIRVIAEEGVLRQTLLLYLHILSLGAWIGMQAWVIGVAGIVMYLNMPRHVFGHIQSKLWPLFYCLGSGLSLLGILTNTAAMNTTAKKNSREEIQVSGLLMSLICCLLNAFLLEPRGTRLWMARFDYEQKQGYGQEVGPLKNKEGLKTKRYKELTDKFARVHGCSSIVTVFAFVGCLVHLGYLTHHLVST